MLKPVNSSAGRWNNPRPIWKTKIIKRFQIDIRTSARPVLKKWGVGTENRCGCLKFFKTIKFFNGRSIRRFTMSGTLKSGRKTGMNDLKFGLILQRPGRYRIHPAGAGYRPSFYHAGRWPEPGCAWSCLSGGCAKTGNREFSSVGA